MNKKIITVILALATALSIFVVFKMIPNPRNNQINKLNQQIKLTGVQTKQTNIKSKVKKDPLMSGQVNLPQLEETSQDKLTAIFAKYYGKVGNVKTLKTDASKDQDILGRTLQTHLMNMTALMKDDGTSYLLAKKNIKTLVGFRDLQDNSLHATAIVYVQYLPTGSKTDASHVFYLDYDLKTNRVLNYTDHDINV